MNSMASLSSQAPAVCEISSIQNMEHPINTFYEQHLDLCSKKNKKSSMCISTFPKLLFVAMTKKISLLSHEFKEFFIPTILNAMTSLPGLNESKKQNMYFIFGIELCYTAFMNDVNVEKF